MRYIPGTGTHTRQRLQSVTITTQHTLSTFLHRPREHQARVKTHALLAETTGICFFQ